LLANLEIKKFASRDEQEVAGFAEGMGTVFHAWADIPITDGKMIGIVFETATPFDTLPRMAYRPKVSDRGRIIFPASCEYLLIAGRA